jgi:hypothetical protein
MHAPRALPARLPPARLLTAGLLTAGLLTACDPGRRPSILNDEGAREAGLKSLAWMERRVGLMVESKASCEQMAGSLLTHDRASLEELKRWRAAGAQEWLIARSQTDAEFERALSELITKGDLVYSYCAFFEDFRHILAQGERG